MRCCCPLPLGQESSELHSDKVCPTRLKCFSMPVTLHSCKVAPCSSTLSPQSQWPLCASYPLDLVEFCGLLRMTMPFGDLKTTSYALKSPLSQASPSEGGGGVGQPFAHHCHPQVILLCACAHQPSVQEPTRACWDCLCA